MSKYKQQIFYLFGVFDVITLAIYVIHQLVSSRLPFYDDVLSIKQITMQFEPYSFALFIFLAFLFVLLFLSLLVSSYLFFTQNSKVKWVALIQTPFRLVAMPHTVPFLGSILLIFIPSIGVAFILAFVEILKSYWLVRNK